MEIVDIPTPGFERLVKATDPESGLRALICVHDTTLGPALGGLRMWPYASEDEAIFDVTRLAAGMTYKSAVARTGLGGGKAVIIGSPETKSEALYLAMGRFIDALDGTYITAEDVNTKVEDLAIIRRATRWVTGLARELGGSDDPSPFTAYGVFLGVRAALERKTGSDDLAGRTVAVQGVGAVGGGLARRLAAAGARVLVADRREDRVAKLCDEIGAEAVDEDEILTAEADVLAPCALGGILNKNTIPALRCKVVAGAANNQLLTPEDGVALRERGIVYAPDYVINAGGIIHIAESLQSGGYDEARSRARVERIPEALREAWTLADEQNIAVSEAADRLARDILAEGRAAAAG